MRGLLCGSASKLWRVPADPVHSLSGKEPSSATDNLPHFPVFSVDACLPSEAAGQEPAGNPRRKGLSPPGRCTADDTLPGVGVGCPGRSRGTGRTQAAWRWSSGRASLTGILLASLKTPPLGRFGGPMPHIFSLTAPTFGVAPISSRKPPGVQWAPGPHRLPLPPQHLCLAVGGRQFLHKRAHFCLDFTGVSASGRWAPRPWVTC